MLGMPDSRWSARTDPLVDQDQLDNFLEEILEIADDNSRDYVKKTGVDGKVTWVVDREHIVSCRLRIGTRKLAAARMAPRKFGNR
jgi:hypothetical protein